MSNDTVTEFSIDRRDRRAGTRRPFVTPEIELVAREPGESGLHLTSAHRNASVGKLLHDLEAI
jgi:hypothetical protein